MSPNGNPGTAAPGFFGTTGRYVFDFNPELFKVPHLRNAYQKIGMFGNPANPGLLPFCGSLGHRRSRQECPLDQARALGKRT